MELSDHLDCSFLGYERLEDGCGGNGTNTSDEAEVSELSFHMGRDVFTKPFDTNLGGPFLLVKLPSDGGDAPDIPLPSLPVVHQSYWGLERLGLAPGRAFLLGDSSGIAHTSQNANERFRSDIFTSWRSYLTRTLHLSEIPRLTRLLGSDYFGRRYSLSKEFKFLFQACSASDVLQLLNEHWTRYAEWVEPGATPQNNSNTGIADSKRHLIQEIGLCEVQTRHGSCPLSQTILPGLDPQIDGFDIPVPILEMERCGDPTLRRRLGILGIKVENNVQYYLACLRALARQQFQPGHDAISYIYEQIQARYSSNEDEIKWVANMSTQNAPGLTWNNNTVMNSR